VTEAPNTIIMPPRDNAATRARAGITSTTTVTVDRPDTEVRGPNGDVFRL